MCVGGGGGGGGGEELKSVWGGRGGGEELKSVGVEGEGVRRKSESPWKGEKVVQITGGRRDRTYHRGRRVDGKRGQRLNDCREWGGKALTYRAFQVACNLQKRSRDQTDQSAGLIA